MPKQHRTRGFFGVLTAALTAAKLLLCPGLSIIPAVSPAATFTVVNLKDSGPGSFRQAILDANTSPGADVINFDIPGPGVRTIRPSSPLPDVTDPVVISGESLSGFLGTPILELDGSSAGSLPGLRLLGGNTSVSALVLNRFKGGAIHIKGPGTNTVVGNFLGTDPSGTLARPNNQTGILIEASSGNRIGTSEAGQGNLISGNNGVGVYLLNAKGNMVEGNRIGVAVNGDLALPNSQNGVALYNSASNQVGSLEPAGRNVISGNLESGLHLIGRSASGNRVTGNYVGVGVSGTSSIPNHADGITISAPNNQIGGPEPAAANVISGNALAGVHLNGADATNNVISGNFIGTDPAGLFALGNGYSGLTLHRASRNRIGGPLPSERNLLSGNLQSGCLLSTNSTENVFLGNWFGVDSTGARALPNGFNGITLQSAPSNSFGGLHPADGNLIAGNLYYGLELDARSSANRIQGNRVGTDQSGNQPVPNGQSGIRVSSDANLLEGNLVSGNGQHGIFISGPTASHNRLCGNTIGLNLSGLLPLRNGKAGVLLSRASFTHVGTPQPGAGNLISGNADAGIYLYSSVSNSIQGNRVGVNRPGCAAVPNSLEGIYCVGSDVNLLGGPQPGAGNLIAGNLTRGIWLTNSSSNIIQGNRLGLAADIDASLPNGAHAIEFESGATGNLLGGQAPNVVAFAPAGFAGVRVRAGSHGNAILDNSLFGHGGLAIDLGPVGFQEPDPCDADLGANLLQNPPTLSSALLGDRLVVRGSLMAAPNQNFLLQFFANPASLGPNAGEARTFLGECRVGTGKNCQLAFAASLPPPSWTTLITATATDAANNTSECSPCVPLTFLPSLVSAVSESGMQLFWPDNGVPCHLEFSPTLGSSAQWSIVEGVVSAQGGKMFTLVPTQASGFYRLAGE